MYFWPRAWSWVGKLAVSCDGTAVSLGTRSGAERGAYELLVQRDLVELELVNLRRGTAQQRGGCQQSERLHDGQGG